MVYTVYVSRRPGHEEEAEALFSDLRHNLMLDGLTSVRYINRYFADSIKRDIFEKAIHTVFSEPQTDVFSETFAYDENERVLAVEFLPGQYDQRADSCEQCIQILAYGERPKIKTAVIYTFSGAITENDFDRIKKYMINPVESREASLDIPETLDEYYPEPEKVAVLEGFCDMTADDFKAFAGEYGLVMDVDDLLFCHAYFKNEEKRDPTMTELRMIDAYWSDHCRHTTFLTSIKNTEIEDPRISAAYSDYLEKRKFVYGSKERDITLMDMATLAAKYLKKQDRLPGLDESEEINACSVKIKVKTDSGDEDWLLMFKNETHNHPTEIEPYGGAATCLGGAIRDPLAGRAYVYQAMRVTGAGDPRVAVRDTLRGKLPQSKLTVTAANGYSSYGNQIGLATGSVHELYHPGYVAKRLELGAVVGAVPAANVIRQKPTDGDVVILLGGRTGRDGCGGATGSSKAHTSSSLVTCGAEVQKGNPLIERKIQRLFRNKEVTTLIKRCNDFGAGGVSVAIGELADGLEIDLSLIPKKYEGLDGTELAISESQERMAVVTAQKDAGRFIAYAEKENLEATPVARVTAEPRLRMRWNNDVIVDLSREFLNSNGAKKHASVKVKRKITDSIYAGLSAKLPIDIKEAFIAMISDLNVCSQKGLSERFDSSIGASTVLMPFGGKYQTTPSQYMAAKIPVSDGIHDCRETETASVMAWGFDPYLSELDPFTGAYCAVVESLAKLTAAGIPFKNAYLTFQEYFEKLRDNAERWGKPFSALLGAFKAQTELGVAAIGGKDSMSGSFEKMDVPPTLVSFAIAAGNAGELITPEFKKAGSRVYLMKPETDPATMLPSSESVRKVFDTVSSMAKNSRILSAYSIGRGGIAEGIVKMCFGNRLGFDFSYTENIQKLFELNYGALLIETDDDSDGILLGHTSDKPRIVYGEVEIPLDELEEQWQNTLESVFPTKPRSEEKTEPQAYLCTERSPTAAAVHFAQPRVVIPVFPGTNCEYDTARAVTRAKGKAEIFVLRNLTPKQLTESTEELSTMIDRAQIFVLPGGFSGGDEPHGSGKFITAVLRSPRISEAITRLLDDRGGLILGICNGFQALIKSGLLPYGRIMEKMTPDCPTLTFNKIKRHQSMMVTTRITSVKSPWLNLCEPGQLHTIPISHGEGRFTASDALIRSLAAEGRITTQYVNPNSEPTMDTRYNPNSSEHAIESIISPDGRILGKMGHSERTSRHTAKNVPGDQNQRLFESGIKYFK